MCNLESLSLNTRQELGDVHFTVLAPNSESHILSFQVLEFESTCKRYRRSKRLLTFLVKVITNVDCVDNHTHDDVYIVKTYSNLIITLVILMSILATSLAIHHSNVVGVWLRRAATLENCKHDLPLKWSTCQYVSWDVNTSIHSHRFFFWARTKDLRMRVPFWDGLDH